MTDIIQIEALARFQAPLRIEWFGNILRRPHRGGTAVQVVTSCGVFDTPFGRHSARSVEVELPVGFLRRFKLGDIWEDGRHRDSEGLRREVFADLAIDSNTSSLVKAGESDLTGNYPLDFRVFDRHRRHTASWLVRVDLAGREALLVPMMELIRFLFWRRRIALEKLVLGFLC
jgi:hypothetical protein